jgi:hypothetical protein
MWRRKKMTDRMFFRLLSAVDVHRDLIESGELSEDVANRALWLAAELMGKEAGKCTGGCCG